MNNQTKAESDMGSEKKQCNKMVYAEEFEINTVKQTKMKYSICGAWIHWNENQVWEEKQQIKIKKERMSFLGKKEILTASPSL